MTKPLARPSRDSVAIVRVVRDRVLRTVLPRRGIRRRRRRRARVDGAGGARAGAAGAPRAPATTPTRRMPAELESLIAGSSACPGPIVLRGAGDAAAARPPGPRLRALPGAPPVVELVDLGVPFQVIVAGRVREYRDEARDCTHRARVAAVFVALTIDPAFVARGAAPRRPPRRRRRRRERGGARAAAARRARGSTWRPPSTRRRVRGSRRPGRRSPARLALGPRAARVRRGRDRALAGRHQRRRRAPASVAAADRRGRPRAPRRTRLRALRRAGPVRRGACPRPRWTWWPANSRTRARDRRARRVRRSRRRVALRAVRGAARRADSRARRRSTRCRRAWPATPPISGSAPAPARRSSFCDDRRRTRSCATSAVARHCGAGGGCGPRLDVGSDVLWTGAVRGQQLRRMDGRRRRRRAGVSAAAQPDRGLERARPPRRLRGQADDRRPAGRLARQRRPRARGRSAAAGGLLQRLVLPPAQHQRRQRTG